MKGQAIARLGLALGVVLALLTAVLIHEALLKASLPPPAAPTMTEVVMAQAVGPDTDLTPQDLTTRTIETKDAPPGLQSSVSQVQGQVTEGAMVPGEPVLTSLLYPTAQAAGITAQIPRNMRAAEVPVNAQSGVGSALQPGDRVDVLTLLPGKSGTETSLLMSDVLILALVSGSSTVTTPGTDTSGYSGVILEVSDRQAGALFLATNQGAIELVLRGAGDRTPATAFTVPSSGLKGVVGP